MLSDCVTKGTVAGRLACVGARQGRRWVCAGARMRQPFASRRVLVVLDLAACREASLHSLRSFRSDSLGESEDEAALRARGHEPRPCRPRRTLRPCCSPGAANPVDCPCPSSPPRRRICRCRRTLRPRLCQHHRSVRGRTPRASSARWAVLSGGDFGGEKQQISAVGARCSALRSADSRRLSECSERSERSELRGASALRASQRSRCEAPTATVGAPLGTTHRAAPRYSKSAQ